MDKGIIVDEKRREGIYDFSLLQDKPLEDGEGDIFGHREIANSIIEVIKKAPRPFNIGIYGQWGVGKSTICKIIEKLLKEQEKETYSVVYFDTWKYERDSFRRQFLITLDHELELNLDFENKLNQSLTKVDPTLGEIKFDGRLLFNKIAIIPLLLFGAGSFCLALGQTNDFYNLFFSEVAFLGLATYAIQIVVNGIFRVQTSTMENKTDSAEGFESHFINVISSPKIEGKDLLIIIDNLDRLSSGRAVDLLSDIKTFLSDEEYSYGDDGKKIKNRAIFLVPCDSKAINDQLLKEYGENFSTEEYLRKFFNHSIQIPKFLNIELDDFIVNKLNATKIEEFRNNYDLVFILSSAFRNNPREIIQFINSLISLFLLARERGIFRIVEKQHVAFLAKILVLRSKWPDLYNRIEEGILRTGDKLSEITSEFARDKGAEARNLHDFLRTTSYIDDKDYQDIYFSLRQSEAQKTIPEWESFIISLIENRKDDAEKIYKNIQSNNGLPRLGNLLTDYCRRHEKNSSLLFNIFLTVHSIVEIKDVKYFQDVFLLIFKNTNSEMFVSSAEKINFLFLFKNGMKEISSPDRREFFSRHFVSIIRHISSFETIGREKIKCTRKLFEIIDSKENRDNFKNKNIELIDIKKQFISHLRCRDLFPETQNSGKFRMDILNDVLDILVLLGPRDSKHYSAGLTLLNNLLRWESIAEEGNARLSILKRSLEFFERLKPSPSDRSVENTIGSFMDTISVCYLSDKSSVERSICAKIFQKLDLDIKQNSKSAEFINRYITEKVNDAETILETLGEDFIINNENARRSLIIRSGATLDLLSILPLKENLTDKEKVDIFIGLNRDNKEIISFLEYVDYILPPRYEDNHSFLKDAVLEMINSISSCSIDLLEKWLDAIARLGVQPDQSTLFIKNLRWIKDRSERHRQIVTNFVYRNPKYFNLPVNDPADSNSFRFKNK